MPTNHGKLGGGHWGFAQLDSAICLSPCPPLLPVVSTAKATSGTDAEGFCLHRDIGLISQSHLWWFLLELPLQ